MRLSKNRISKILGVNNQSIKKYKRRRIPKRMHKKSFRKKKPLNLREKTLRYYKKHRRHKKIFIGGGPPDDVVEEGGKYYNDVGVKADFIDKLVELTTGGEIPPKVESESEAGIITICHDSASYDYPTAPDAVKKYNDMFMRSLTDYSKHIIDIYKYLTLYTDELLKKGNMLPDSSLRDKLLQHLYMSRVNIVNPTQTISYSTALAKIKGIIGSDTKDITHIKNKMGLSALLSDDNKEVDFLKAWSSKEVHINIDEFHCFVNSISKKIKKTKTDLARRCAEGTAFAQEGTSIDCKEKTSAHIVLPTREEMGKKLLEISQEARLAHEMKNFTRATFNSLAKDEMKNMLSKIVIPNNITKINNLASKFTNIDGLNKTVSNTIKSHMVVDYKNFSRPSIDDALGKYVRGIIGATRSCWDYIQAKAYIIYHIEKGWYDNYIVSHNEMPVELTSSGVSDIVRREYYEAIINASIAQTLLNKIMYEPNKFPERNFENQIKNGWKSVIDNTDRIKKKSPKVDLTKQPTIYCSMISDIATPTHAQDNNPDKNDYVVSIKEKNTLRVLEDANYMLDHLCDPKHIDTESCNKTTVADNKLYLQDLMVPFKFKYHKLTGDQLGKGYEKIDFNLFKEKAGGGDADEDGKKSKVEGEEKSEEGRGVVAVKQGGALPKAEDYEKILLKIHEGGGKSDIKKIISELSKGLTKEQAKATLATVGYIILYFKYENEKKRTGLDGDLSLNMSDEDMEKLLTKKADESGSGTGSGPGDGTGSSHSVSGMSNDRHTQSYIMRSGDGNVLEIWGPLEPHSERSSGQNFLNALYNISNWRKRKRGYHPSRVNGNNNGHSEDHDTGGVVGSSSGSGHSRSGHGSGADGYNDAPGHGTGRGTGHGTGRGTGHGTGRGNGTVHDSDADDGRDTGRRDGGGGAVGDSQQARRKSDLAPLGSDNDAHLDIASGTDSAAAAAASSTEAAATAAAATAAAATAAAATAAASKMKVAKESLDAAAAAETEAKSTVATAEGATPQNEKAIADAKAAKTALTAAETAHTAAKTAHTEAVAAHTEAVAAHKAADEAHKASASKEKKTPAVAAVDTKKALDAAKAEAATAKGALDKAAAAKTTATEEFKKDHRGVAGKKLAEATAAHAEAENNSKAAESAAVKAENIHTNANATHESDKRKRGEAEAEKAAKEQAAADKKVADAAEKKRLSERSPAKAKAEVAAAKHEAVKIKAVSEHNAKKEKLATTIEKHGPESHVTHLALHAHLLAESEHKLFLKHHKMEEEADLKDRAKLVTANQKKQRVMRTRHREKHAAEIKRVNIHRQPFRPH